jgi:uncharacterized delta-60 repeat protein
LVTTIIDPTVSASRLKPSLIIKKQIQLKIMKKMRRQILIALCLFMLAGIRISAQDAGALDLSFNGNGTLVTDNGFLDLYTDVCIQDDGKIIAVGMSYDNIYAATIQVVRLKDNGTLDPSFGSGGVFTYHLNYETDAYACMIKDDGTILVAGITTDVLGAFAMIVLHLDQSGALISSFGNQGVAYIDLGPGEDIAYDITLQEDQKILLAGYSSNDIFLNAPVIVRLNADGSLDETFGNNGVATIPVTEMDNEFSCLQVQEDGKIVAAGHISNGLSWFSLLVARFDTTGNLDTTFGTQGLINLNLNNVDDEFFDLVIAPDHSLILSGFTTTPGSLDYHLLLMKFDAQGAADEHFGIQGKVILDDIPYMVGNALVLQPDGKILVAGTSGQKMPMDNDWAIWRFNSAGTQDETFGTSGTTLTNFFDEPDEALGIAIIGDKIVVAGKARNGSESFNYAVARYMNDISVSIPETDQPTGFDISPNPAGKSETMNLSYRAMHPEALELSIFDLKGRKVSALPIQQATEGFKTFSFSLPLHIEAGTYVLKLAGTSYTATKKLVILE